MDDNELLDALRTGLDGVDPPPPNLRAAAILAGRWNAQADSQAVPVARELVGMRSSTGDNRASQTFTSSGYEIEVQVHSDENGDDRGATVTATVTPSVDEITVAGPGIDARVLVPEPGSRFTFEVQHRLFTISFVGVDGVLVRTPLIDTLE